MLIIENMFIAHTHISFQIIFISTRISHSFNEKK
jgi:hypothetical protein